jgi:hypothetical protein
LILIALALACSAVSPGALGGNPHGSPTPTVTPTPTPSPTPIGDRGNENTAIGDGALFNLTSGVNNTAMGFHALFSNTIGNTTADGVTALFSNTTGLQTQPTVFKRSIATRPASKIQPTVMLRSIPTLPAPTRRLLSSAFSNTTSNGNMADGYGALYYNTTGFDNTAIAPLRWLTTPLALERGHRFSSAGNQTPPHQQYAAGNVARSISITPA